MKHTHFTCDFCSYPIDNTKAMYRYTGGEYDWLFDYEDEFHLHGGTCTELFAKAKRLAMKVAYRTFKAASKKLAPRCKPVENEEPNEDW